LDDRIEARWSEAGMAPMRAVLMGAAALAAAAILSLWRLQEPAAPPPVATAEFPAAAPHPQTAATTAESAAAPETPMAGTPGAASAPAFDVVRVERDGDAVFAGTAAPGAEVQIRIGETVIATARAGRDGAFVAYGKAPVSQDAQRLDVWSDGGGGAMARADVSVLLAPPRGVAADRAPQTGAPPPQEAPIVAQLRPSGVTIAQAQPRPADQAVTLDLVSYSDEGWLEISGRAEALRRLRIYANAVMIAETWVAADGRWSTRAAAGLAPGDYRLRVDLLGDDGAVRSRVESPFRRESVEAATLAAGQIVVQPGDTLWAIAENRYGEGVRYSVIYQANAARIRNPDLIYPGQIFAVPDPDPSADAQR